VSFGMRWGFRQSDLLKAMTANIWRALIDC
jgi:hypothetical protein